MDSRSARPFRDRVHAGRVLAQKLKHFADRPDVLVLSLPRGGMPVGFEVSTALHVPMAAVETCEEFRSEVDEVICAVTPTLFHAVGLWYEEFSQTSDEEVRDLLARAHPAAVHSGGRWERQ